MIGQSGGRPDLNGGRPDQWSTRFSDMKGPCQIGSCSNSPDTLIRGYFGDAVTADKIGLVNRPLLASFYNVKYYAPH